MKQNSRSKVLLVSEPASVPLDCFNFAVQTFCQGICNAMENCVYNSLQMTFQCFRRFDDTLKPRMGCPPVPALELRFKAWRGKLPHVTQGFPWKDFPDPISRPCFQPLQIIFNGKSIPESSTFLCRQKALSSLRLFPSKKR